MPENSKTSDVDSRRRDLSRAGLDLSDDRIRLLMNKFDDVDATAAAIRKLRPGAFEPHAVFTPRPPGD